MTPNQEMPKAENPTILNDELPDGEQVGDTTETGGMVDPGPDDQEEAAEGNPDNPTEQPPTAANPVKADQENLVTLHEALKDDHGTISHLLSQAIEDAKAFINQVDRDGLGMASVTDHRKRVEKFFVMLKNAGRL